nr:hypothetical protein [uncultured Roseococcus sp.]
MKLKGLLGQTLAPTTQSVADVQADLRVGSNSADPIKETSLTWLETAPSAKIKTFVNKLAFHLSRAADTELKANLQRLARATVARMPLRRLGVSAAQKLAPIDDEFIELVRSADQARDRHAWHEGEYGYWRALQLYPIHPGYVVQYGHCLKEQRKLPDAEIAYRNAYALGEESADLQRHIAFVAAERGARINQGTLDQVAGFWSDRCGEHAILEAPPTSDDLRAVMELLLGRGPADLGEFIEVLDGCPTLSEAVKRIMQKPDFVVANREFLRFVTETMGRSA